MKMNQQNEQQETIKKKTLKVKLISFLAINMWFIYVSSVYIGVYLVYRSIVYFDKISFAILVILNIYNLFFCKKSDIVNYIMSNCEYFKKLEIITEDKILDDKKSMIAMHPHCQGFFGGIIASFKKNSPLRKFQLLGTSTAINIAPHGIVFRLWGIKSIAPENMKKLMQEERNISLIPGGFEEATLTSNKEYRLFLKQRKGFIKYALRFGYKVHPTFVFNENKVFSTTDLFMKLRLWLNKFKIPAIVYYSKYLFYPNPDFEIFVVIGQGIQFPQIDNPSEQDIISYHNLYTQKLKELFYRNVDKYDPGAKLKIDEFDF